MNIRYYKGHLKTKRSKFLVSYHAQDHRGTNSIGSITLTLGGRFIPKNAKEYIEKEHGFKNVVITSVFKL